MKVKFSYFSNNAYILMFILLLMWGSFAATSKLLLKSIDNFQVQFYMFGIAFAVMTLILVFTGKIKELAVITASNYLKLVLYAFPSYTYYFFYFMALRLVSAIEASMLNYLFPVILILLAVPINEEKLDRGKILSVILGFIGMVIIVTNGNLSSVRLTNLIGDLLAIAAAVSWGVFSNLGKKNKVDSVISNYVYIIVGFFFSVISMIIFSEFIIPDIAGFCGLAWLSMSNIVMAYYLWFRVLKAAPSILVSSLSFITPFVTLVFIMLLLGERIMPSQFLGLFMIIMGIFVQRNRLCSKIGGFVRGGLWRKLDERL